MFDPSSRYFGLETVTVERPGGGAVAYKRRRLVPPADTLPPLSEYTVTAWDRLDVIAGRTLGDPEQFWRLCDANDALDPLALTAEPGRTLRIPMPRP